MQKGEDVVVLDVRNKDEFSEGKIAGSILLPVDAVDEKVEKVLTDKGKFIVTQCRRGVRSKAAALVMQALGYTQVYSLEGGIEAWKRAGLPTVFPKES